MDAVPLIATLFGWPAVMVSIALTLAGIARGRWPPVLAGAFLGIPFLLYLSASPRIGWLSLVVAGLSISSAQAVARSHRALALVMALPFILLASFVAWIVLRQ